MAKKKKIKIVITKEELLKIQKGERREVMKDFPQKLNQTFKSEKDYTRKKKHKKKGDDLDKH